MLEAIAVILGTWAFWSIMVILGLKRLIRKKSDISGDSGVDIPVSFK